MTNINNPNEDPDRIISKELQHAYKLVYEDLISDNAPNLFKGIYDAINGSEKFMYGIDTVMEFISYNCSEETYDSFSEMFFNNMDKSKENIIKKENL